ncbi:MAG: ead/Ea22-like family protein [Leclercia adecarboxylata]|nr:ead/Ea22-like family protein [Leclercia adecarboxylata]
MTINKQALRSKARSASAGEWIKESGDGWEAICSANDQANGNFIIAHFEGPDAKANREFAQAAHPDVVLALLDELEAAEKRIAELSSNNDSAHKALIKTRRRAVTLPTGYSVRPGHPINETERSVMIPKDGGAWLSRFDVEHALRAAGISIKRE